MQCDFLYIILLNKLTIHTNACNIYSVIFKNGGIYMRKHIQKISATIIAIAMTIMLLP